MSLELAWAAGFFDGEGTCYYRPPEKSQAHRTRRGSRFEFSVCQKDRRPLERFQNALGFGKIYGPYGSSGSHCGMYWWKAGCTNNVLQAIDLLYPYLSDPKRDQIAGALTRREEHLALTSLRRSENMRHQHQRRPMTWTPERRQAQRERALSMVNTGKWGGMVGAKARGRG